MNRSAAISYVLGIKESFIRDKLTPLIKTAESSVDSVSYETEINEAFTDILSETVVICFKNGGEKAVNITGDSPKQIALDVLRKI